MKKPQFGDFQNKYRDPESSRIVILPVCYDETSTWMKGADKGPDAILNASYYLENYDIETDSEVYKLGIFCEDHITERNSTEAMIDKLYKKVSEIYKEEKFPVILGGEHSVSIGAFQASAEKYKDMTILHMDAHADLRDKYQGSKYNHGCVMARAKELTPIVQVGIRSIEKAELNDEAKGNIFFAENITGKKDWMQRAVSKLSGKVYLTFDLDAFDPSIMPSTGTPEPGGLLWYETLAFLKMVFEKKDVIGFDVVELCPNEMNKAPDFLAAKLIYKLLSYKFML